MRTSKYLLLTLKEKPKDAEIISHQLMLRGGLIRSLSSGLYTWLPTGVRVLKKIENIVREEMNKIGSLEVSMPIVQPAELWQESGRLQSYGPELLRFVDRKKRNLVLSPTHEECITDLIRYQVNSYKQLPLNLFQIKTKFRDEPRPRYGIIRSREFIMKDAYSFHENSKCLQKTYTDMYNAYNIIIRKLGLNFKIVEADTGSMGGNTSHEFQVLANHGENIIVFSDISNYVSKIDFAEVVSNLEKKVHNDTSHHSLAPISIISSNLLLRTDQIIKTFLVKAQKNNPYKWIALLIRGDHELNILKAERIDMVAKPLIYANKKELRQYIGTDLSYIGPINLPIPIIADRSLADLKNFSVGANVKDQYYFGINWIRDLKLPKIADLRNVVEGDPSPDGQGSLKLHRSIEIAHIFQLGKKYSLPMKAKIQDKNGYLKNIFMGCYGIGISRMVAASIEQSHDQHGIIWPSNIIAPFQVAIIPIDYHHSNRVRTISEHIYFSLSANNIDIILDDRKEHIGIMLSDMELIGIPHMIIVSDRYLDKHVVVYKLRKIHPNNQLLIDISQIINFIIEKFNKS
ncbi:MAG: proline--tRNA ligase [Candidatus Dasytiphilus stammeri]